MGASVADWFAGRTRTGRASLILAFVAVCCLPAPNAAVGEITHANMNDTLSIAADGADRSAVACNGDGFVTVNEQVIEDSTGAPIRADEVHGLIIYAAQGQPNEIDVSGVTSDRFSCLGPDYPDFITGLMPDGDYIITTMSLGLRHAAPPFPGGCPYRHGSWHRRCSAGRGSSHRPGPLRANLSLQPGSAESGDVR